MTWKNNSSTKGQAGKENVTPKPLIGPSIQRMTCEIIKEAHQQVGFYTKLLIKEAQKGLTQGLPRWQSVCSKIDPMVLTGEPMIRDEGRARIKGSI
ncbi:hypothetical protein Tco_0841585 [Tanacetum coccineum]|uniref:Uncharacterized protein n=1 Tax=Tanacetum coccineum TaxID=301880 RepID=A0ABQ5B084_9ASTR